MSMEDIGFGVWPTGLRLDSKVTLETWLSSLKSPVTEITQGNMFQVCLQELVVVIMVT